MTTSTFSDGLLEFYASCAAGFEQLLAGELSGLGIASPRALRGQVAFSAHLIDAYKVCLWSRIASRVVLVLAHGDAHNSDELYQSLNALAWEDHIPLTATFAIDASGTNDELRNTQFVALRAKDAICDRMIDALGGRPNIETKNPDIRIMVRVRATRVTCGIDLSGQPLFRRANMGYVKDDQIGGIRADYAAALLAAGGWYRCCRKEHPVFIDMFSGTGTLAREALEEALDCAPNLNRARWGFEKWLGHDEASWNALVIEAKQRAEAGYAKSDNLQIIALDRRGGAGLALNRALGNLASSAHVDFAPTNEAFSALLASCQIDTASSLAAVDLSWLSSDALAVEVDALGFARAAIVQLTDATPFVVLSSSCALEASLALESQSSYEVKLGRDDAHMSCYVANSSAMDEGAHVTLKNGTQVPVLVSASDQFAARLAKVTKLRAKWAAREDITCYRVYDADLPDYAVAIDVYEASCASGRKDAGARWLVIQEYAAPKSVDADLAHRRLLDVLAIAPNVLGVAPENVFVRVRSHAKGGSQYADGGQMSSSRGADSTSKLTRESSNGAHRVSLRLAPGSHLIDEGGLTFEVNFNSYLDTGIFLDHRDVRAEVREMAKKTLGSKRFLNLFAYTGTATCYAADGGAKHTTTVDLSTTYLEWAQRNMVRNGFGGPEHEYVRDDVVRWVAEQRHTANRWDLIFCDPPTFSNSKRMGHNVFDVQRDHAELLIGISRLLTKNGVCLFSCNLRGFKPDTEKLARAGVQIEDVTQGSIPEDFSRNAKIHHCYLVRRTPRETA